MNQQPPNHLKLLSDAADATDRLNEDQTRWAACCAAFSECTGQQLEFAPGPAPKRDTTSIWSAPVDPGVGNSLGHIRIVAKPGVAKPDRGTFSKAKHLAAALGELWSELLETREALWRREAELAAGVPVSVGADEEAHLAQRLEAVLAAGAAAAGCTSAALYLLDEGTSQLKLRSSWGLARRSLLEPARPLRGAAADLEALIGHAVVVTDRRLFGYWRVPRACAAAVCVPVSTPNTPLGTLWMFAEQPRDFSSLETNMIELTAGRLAADLEREMLLAEVDRLRAGRSVAAVSARRPAKTPPPVMLDGWDVACWRDASGAQAGAAWMDWFAVASDQMAFSLGCCQNENGGSIESATKAAARAASSWEIGAQEAVGRVNNALWATSDGDADSSLAYVKLDTHHGQVRAALVGQVGMCVLTRSSSVARIDRRVTPPVDKPRRRPNAELPTATIDAETTLRPTAASLLQPAPTGDRPSRVFQADDLPLGQTESITATEHSLKLRPGDALLIWSAPANSVDAATLIAALERMDSMSRELPHETQMQRVGACLAQSPGPASAILITRKC